MLKLRQWWPCEESTVSACVRHLEVPAEQNRVRGRGMAPGHRWLLPRVYPELRSPSECVPLSRSSQDLQLQERVGVLLLGSRQG